MQVAEHDSALKGPDVGGEALAAFWRLWDARREAIDRRIERIAADLPVFAELLENMTPELRRAQAEHSRRLERGAFMEGRWGPLHDHLVAQGETYAAMGIPLPAWQQILGEFRVSMRSEIELEHPDDADARLRHSDALDRYLDWAMATLGSAYVAERQKIVDRTAGTLELYRDLFDHASLGMQIFARRKAGAGPAEFDLVAANRNAVGLVGLDPAPGAPIALQLDDESPLRLELHQRLCEVVDSGAPSASDLVDLDASGVPRYLAVRAFSLGTEHVGVVLEDVTTSRRLEAARRRALESLARSNRELDHFAYVASHDLRAPLRDVDNLASWIEEDAADELPPDSRRHFEQLRARILRMERLLEDLLEYSRVGRRHQVAQKLDTRTVIEAVLEQVGVPDAFEVVVEGESTEAHTPRVPLEQVLRNLVDNAVKHHGGERGRITIGQRRGASMLHFFVRDDGAGIAPEYHQRIFAMFQTLKPRDETEGSGMGLALVKKIVERHGGMLEVDSAPGRGSEFSFTWPIEWSEEAEDAEG